MSRSELVAQGINEIVTAFGYLEESMPEALSIVREILERTPTHDDLAFAVEDKILFSCFWAESRPAPCPLGEDGLTQSPQILANQLAGFFPHRAGLRFGKIGKFESLAYVGDPSSSLVVVQQSSESGPMGPTHPLFCSVGEEAQASHDWTEARSLRLAHQDGQVSEAEWSLGLDEFIARYPRLVKNLGAEIDEAFSKVEVDLPDLVAADQRALRVLDIANWITATLAGQPCEVPDGAISLLADSEAGQCPPLLILQPLGQIAQGDRENGLALARDLAKHGRGVPLTQRWAKRIIDRGGENLLEE